MTGIDTPNSVIDMTSAGKPTKVHCPHDDVCGDGKAGGIHCDPHTHTRECDRNHGRGFCPPCIPVANARLQGCERSEHTLQGVVRHSDSGGAA